MSGHKRGRSDGAPALTEVELLAKKKSLTGSNGDDAAPWACMELLSTVACGRCFCLVISGEGKITTWGKNSAGQLGTGNDTLDRPLPMEVRGFKGEKFAGVACGNFHSLAVTDEGDVYAWGSNARGRLGVGRTSQKEGNPVKIPRNVFSYHRVLSVGCGLHHSIFLLDDGTVYSSGCNENGQLGRPQGFRQVNNGSPDPAPVVLPVGARVVRIASGRHHVLALTADGELLGWGKNDVGQLGVLMHPNLGLPGASDIAIPVKVPGAWAGIRMFDCGRNHSMVISVDDTLWAFGQNVDLQLGFPDRQDRVVPVELERFNGVRVREIACGSRQTCILTEAGHLYAWGWLLHDSDAGLNFSPLPPTRYLEENQLPPEVTINSITAGSTHMLVTLSDGTIQVVGENLDNSLCQGHADHTDKVYPPVFVRTPKGEKFIVTIPKQDARFMECSPLGVHLIHILNTGFDSNIVLRSLSGVQYHLHRFVLHVRCPVLLEAGVTVPDSPAVCKQLFDWIYGQHCDLSHLTACELVQLLQLLQRCEPHLGQLAVKAERTFVQLISTDKEEALLVASMADIMGSRLGDWVKVCLCDHLKNHVISEREASRVPQSILAEVAVISHQKNLRRPEIVPRPEHTLEQAFMGAMGDVAFADFEIAFAQPGMAPLRVHLCMVSRMAFFEALHRNMHLGKGERKFVSHTPRSAMISLLRYIYGGEPTFSAWDALYLMSPENGAAFYFAGTVPEVELIQEAAQAALSEMDVRDAVTALLKAQELNIVQAEAVLIDLIADHYLEAEEMLDEISSSHSESVLISIHKQIIRSLLARNGGGGADLNGTQGDAGL